MIESTLFERDLEFLQNSINQVILRRGKTFVELGCEYGGTAELNVNFIMKATDKFRYYGVDYNSEICTFKHSNYEFVSGDFHSDKVITTLPKEIDWLFIDGCHCRRCVLHDANAYIPRLSCGGMVCFHDATPKMKPQHIEVHQALQELDVRKLRIRLVQQALPQVLGGVQIYLKDILCL